MGHGPAVKLGKDNAAEKKTKLGIKMFIAYSLVYAAFVILNTTNPKLMEATVMGQTAAVLWGFGLIALALVMAVVYNHMCTQAEKEMND